MGAINRFITLLRLTLKEFGADHMEQFAASISFNLFFSLFPIAFATVYIAESIPGSSAIKNQIFRGVDYLLPGFQQLISSNITAASDQVGLMVFLGLVWGGISFFNSIRLSLNVAWGIKRPQSIFKTELINFLLLVSAGFFVFLSVFFTALLNTDSENGLPGGIVQLFDRSPVMLILANVLVAVFAFLLFLLFYKYMPIVKPAWKDIWLGALTAAAFFEITKVIFVLYLGLFDPFTLMDRSIGTAIGFMMWTNMSALIFLFVAKMTHVNLRLSAKTAK